MKTLLGLILGMGAMAGAVQGADEASPAPTTITTLSGKTYRGVKILKAYPDGLAFRHANGAAQIPFADLPEDLQKRFQYSPEAAAAYLKEHREAEKLAAEKVALARAERRKKQAEVKLAAMQLAMVREQAMAANAGYPVAAYGDYGVPTWGYGYGADFVGTGLDLLPPLGTGVGFDGRRSRFFDARAVATNALFYNYSIPSYIGPYSALYSGAITNSNVRPTLTFGGYNYPTALAYPVPLATKRFGGHRGGAHPGHHGMGSGNAGHHGMGSGNAGHPGLANRPGHSRGGPRAVFLPANTAGARIGGTGGMMRVGSPRISHR